MTETSGQIKRLVGHPINLVLETWNEHFAHPFNWVYRGVGLTEKVVCRFCTWLETESSTITRKFLNKQFQLLVNALEGYREQIRRRHRQRLSRLLQEKKEYLTAIIDGESLVTAHYDRLCKATTESFAA